MKQLLLSITMFRGSLLLLVVTVVLLSCQTRNKQQSLPGEENNNSTLEKRREASQAPIIYDGDPPSGMVWIPGGVFEQGASANDRFAMHHEKPAHKVRLHGFFMDIHEVTNAQFANFVEATGYQTVAERPVDWKELQKQLPLGTEKPHDSLMQPGSLVFRKTKDAVPNLFDFSQWWHWTLGANWLHPKGPGSSIEGKENHPVVHIAYEDALAYCEWAKRRLPTEAEWEYASRGGLQNTVFFWGNQAEQLHDLANTWTGQFPVSNNLADGFEETAPVKTYSPNAFGLYDMAGNVWEWTQDWYHSHHYKEQADKGVTMNPTGPVAAYNASNPYAQEKVIKGGSYLCNASYCASYRNAARMATSLDSSTEHLGFRTVASPEMLE